MSKKIKYSDFHHKACAQLLMKEFGVNKTHLPEVVEKIKKIYDSQGFAHSLIILSLRGFRESNKTLELKYFLCGNGKRRPDYIHDNHDAMIDF